MPRDLPYVSSETMSLCRVTVKRCGRLEDEVLTGSPRSQLQGGLQINRDSGSGLSGCEEQPTRPHGWCKTSISLSSSSGHVLRSPLGPRPMCTCSRSVQWPCHSSMCNCPSLGSTSLSPGSYCYSISTCS